MAALALLYSVRRGVDYAIHKLRTAGPQSAGVVLTRLDVTLDELGEAHSEIIMLAADQAKGAAG